MVDLTALVECSDCGVEFEAVWHDDSDTVEDMTDAPEAALTCPGCGGVFSETWPGWNWHSEAG